MHNFVVENVMQHWHNFYAVYLNKKMLNNQVCVVNQVISFHFIMII